MNRQDLSEALVIYGEGLLGLCKVDAVYNDGSTRRVDHTTHFTPLSIQCGAVHFKRVKPKTLMQVFGEQQ